MTIRSIIARETCLSHVHELAQVLNQTKEAEGDVIKESIDILNSLRMLTLNVVQNLIQWRKQLVYNYMMTHCPKNP